MSAAHYKLDNLIAIVDANGMGLDGNIEDVMNIEPVAAKFEAFGWTSDEIDGHDISQVMAAFRRAQDADRPHVIVARTKKGKGVRFMEETPFWHLGYLGPDDKAIAVAEINARMAK